MTTDKSAEGGSNRSRLAAASATALLAGALSLPMGVMAGGCAMLFGGGALNALYTVWAPPHVDVGVGLYMAAIFGAVAVGALLMLVPPAASGLLGLLGVGLTWARWHRTAIATLALALVGGALCALLSVSIVVMSWGSVQLVLP